jgi:hypothetical protein
MRSWMSRFFPPSQHSAGWSQESILKQWDDATRKGEFPHFASDSHWAFGKARLSAFRSDDEWLTIFELLTYYNGLADFEIIVYAFGNKLRNPGVQAFSDSSKYSVELTKKNISAYGVKTPIGQSWRAGEQSADAEEWCPDPLDFEVTLGEIQKRFRLTPNDYREAGINLSSSLSGDRCLDQIIRVLRIVGYLIPGEQLFHPEAVLLTYLGRPRTLPLFIQLYEWCHPGINDIHMPSDSVCLQSLAQALWYNDVRLYECSKEQMNTHWSHWPQFKD